MIGITTVAIKDLCSGPDYNTSEYDFVDRGEAIRFMSIAAEVPFKQVYAGLYWGRDKNSYTRHRNGHRIVIRKGCDE